MQYCLLLSASYLGGIADPDSAVLDAAIDLGVHPKTVRAPPWDAHSAWYSGGGQVCRAYNRHLSCSDIGRAIYARARLQAFRRRAQLMRRFILGSTSSKYAGSDMECRFGMGKSAVEMCVAPACRQQRSAPAARAWPHVCWQPTLQRECAVA